MPSRSNIISWYQKGQPWLPPSIRAAWLSDLAFFQASFPATLPMSACFPKREGESQLPYEPFSNPVDLPASLLAQGWGSHSVYAIPSISANEKGCPVLLLLLLLPFSTMIRFFSRARNKTHDFFSLVIMYLGSYKAVIACILDKNRE